MAHLINVGKSESGKTTFTADHVFPAAAASGLFEGIIVYDKMFHTSPRWRSGHSLPVKSFGDLSAFYDAVYSNVNHLVVIDELGAISIKEQEENITPCAQRCRHLGHLLIVMAQRAVNIRPNVRNNTSAYAVFNQSPKDVAELMDLHPDDALKQAPEFETGQGLFKVGSQDVPKVGRLF